MKVKSDTLGEKVQYFLKLTFLSRPLFFLKLMAIFHEIMETDGSD